MRPCTDRGMLSQRIYSSTTSNTPLRTHLNTSSELSSNIGISSNQTNTREYGYTVLRTNWGDCSKAYETYLAQTRVSSFKNHRSLNTSEPPTVASVATSAYKRKNLSHSTDGRRKSHQFSREHEHPHRGPSHRQTPHQLHHQHTGRRVPRHRPGQLLPEHSDGRSRIHAPPTRNHPQRNHRKIQPPGPGQRRGMGLSSSLGNRSIAGR